MDNMSVNYVNIKAFVLEDKVENVYTVFMEGAGGPIISDVNKETAFSKFERALDLSCAVKNVLTFQTAMKANDEQKKEYVKNATPHKRKIEYIEVE